MSLYIVNGKGEEMRVEKVILLVSRGLFSMTGR